MKWRKRSILIFCVCCLVLQTACSSQKSKTVTEENGSILSEKSIFESNKEIGALYESIYKQSYKKEQLDSLHTVEKIVQCLGEAGYSAVDINNQIDMVQPEKLENFCRFAEEHKEGNTTLLLVQNDGGFIRYDFTTAEGEVDVQRSSLRWEEAKMVSDYQEEFLAYTWNYTANGYLFFEQYRPAGYDGSTGHISVRVKPLDAECRAYNRKYVLPVGYALNNLFITDWNEDDYGNIDFYDMFDILYPLKYGTQLPYESDNTGKEYEIPKDEFESVIQSYFKIDSSVLQKKTVYHEEAETYRYRPRSLYDSECPLEPYPEVVAYEPQADGTLKLIINGIWISENKDDAFSSELVVRPMEGDTFQYVSNHVVQSDNLADPIWYEERLTEEEWEKSY